MKSTCLSVLCLLLCAVVSPLAEETGTPDLDGLVDRLWRSQTEEDAAKAYSMVEALPVHAYAPLLLRLYRSPDYQDNEASPYLAAVVYHYYQKKETPAKVQSTLVGLIAAPDTPLNLKRDLLKDITTWAGEQDAGLTVKSLSDAATVKDDAWPYVQYGISKLLSRRYSSTQRVSGKHAQAAELKQLAEQHAKKTMHNLLQRGVEDDLLDRWTVKTLSNYRKILGGEFDQQLTHDLSETDVDETKQLQILHLTCGWGPSSPSVAEYVQTLRDKAVDRGRSLSDRDTEAVKELLKKHGNRSGL